jgi:hypothetical protein
MRSPHKHSCDASACLGDQAPVKEPVLKCETGLSSLRLLSGAIFNICLLLIGLVKFTVVESFLPLPSSDTCGASVLGPAWRWDLCKGFRI